MKRIKQWTSLLLLVMVTFHASAQETVRLNREEAREYAMQHNEKMKNAKLDVIIARKKIWETTAQGLPQVDAQVAYQNIFDVPTASFPTPVLNKTPNEDYPGVYDYELTYVENPIKLGTKQSTTIDITVSQLIFSGSYIVGLQASKLYKELTQEQKAKSELEVKADVSNTYYMILVLEENVKIMENTLENLEKTEYEISEMLNEGFVEDTDLDQVSLSIMNIENAIRTLKSQVEVSYELFKMQLGMDMETNLELTESLDAVVANLAAESLLEKEFQIQNNINYRLLEKQTEMQELDVKLKKSEFLPTISGFYRHQEKTQQADFDFFFPDIIGLNVQVPIFHSAARFSKVKQAKLNLEKTKNQKDQAVKGIRVDVKRAKVELADAVANYRNQQKNLNLSQKIYDKTLAKYKEGLATSMDLTQANNQLLQTQSGYYQSMLNMLKAKVNLNKKYNNL